jgi:hypothetical protein
MQFTKPLVAWSWDFRADCYARRIARGILPDLQQSFKGKSALMAPGGPELNAYAGSRSAQLARPLVGTKKVSGTNGINNFVSH